MTTTPRRRGLGRGLDALLSSSARPASASADGDEGIAVVDLAVDAIDPNPEQPRTTFDDGRLAELSESIRTHGVLQPVVVEHDGRGTYRLIVGERRLRAARLAGMATIPALVRPASESARQNLELALVENLQRAELSPLEEATAFSRLSDAFGLTHDAIALRVGRSRAAVSNAIRLLALPPAVQAHVRAGTLTAGHAKALLGLPDPQEIERLADRAAGQGLTVRQTEQAVAGLLDAHHRPAPRPPRAVNATPPGPDGRTAGSGAGATERAPTGAAGGADAALVRALEDSLGTPVRIDRRRRGGRLVIDFFDEDQLEDLYRRLGGPDL
ncbi:MAG TPA: ParB/RepB/Spo0J family partition protein [Candidatus Dormibacteraeota bacterium]|nr:ParB/RepB/Spo0J family partition protein [Candidatus Dormibacteraeota bacterium]